MSHTPHEINADFPEYQDAFHNLKISDPHFKKIAEDYHVLNREIHRAETNVEPTDDIHLTDLRKQRIVLKDEIYAQLRQASSA